MSIRVGRNASGNCVVFYGQTNPVYFNACLSAVVVDNDYVSVTNDIAGAVSPDSPEPTPVYEYYRIHFSEWRDDDNGTFASAQEAADYINSIGNVTDVPTAGFQFTAEDIMDFIRDETNTSVLISNGDHHGVNAIRAIGKDNGLIGLYPAQGTIELYEMPHTSVLINGSSPGNGLATVVNALNALFTVTATAAPIALPSFTQDGGTEISWNSAETITPVGGVAGTDFGYGSTNSNYHGPRVWTTETINEPGEYFTFEAENLVTGSGALFGMGLYSVDNGDLIEIVDSNLSNSGHHGYFYSQWIYNYSGYSAPWTTYGSHSSLVYGPGWSFNGNAPMFRYSDAHEAFRPGGGANGNALFKVGITDEGFVGVWYYDAEYGAISGTYGARSNDWVLMSRSSTPLPAGEYGLMVKLASSSVVIRSKPLRFATDPAAPVMYYRYIESPDGNFEYPLFATAEEANYYDQENGGSGTSHVHVYADDLNPGTNWYMPDTGATMNGTAAPADTSSVTWSEIATHPDANYIPDEFTAATVTVNEGDSVNYQTAPADAAYTTTFSGLAGTGLTDNGLGGLVGVAPEVTGDNVANPSDSYTITVTRTNEFGSSSGTLTFVVNNLTAPVVDTGNWTVSTGSIVTGVLQNDSTATLGVTLSDLGEGQRLIVPKSWVDTYINPNAIASGGEVYLGVLASGADLADVADADFDGTVVWSHAASSTSHTTVLVDNLGTTQTDVWTNSGAFSVYDYGIEISDGQLYLIACNVNSLNTEPSIADGGSFSRVMTVGAVTGPLTITLGANGSATVDLTDAPDLTKITVPAAPAPSNSTSWTKALDFAGSSERAQQANSYAAYTPLAMGGYGHQIGAPAPGSGMTTTNGHPWATAVVFKSDQHGSNQHIWNYGEGAGDVDDNIYLRVDGGGGLYFGWGRSGALNEYRLANNLGSAAWYAVYVGHNGTRLSGANATAANLEQAFDIRLMYYSSSNGGDWIFNPNTPPGTRVWSTTGGRMDRQIIGDMTVGGRGGNRSFHGKIASFVSTTLRNGVAMPSTDEIKKMVTDPVGWVDTYKVNQEFRYALNNLTWSDFLIGGTQASWATQVWLMGDGDNDSYSNMIRNYVKPDDQNYTKLNMVSMISNDIETVTIPGLT